MNTSARHGIPNKINATVNIMSLRIVSSPFVYRYAAILSSCTLIRYYNIMEIL